VNKPRPNHEAQLAQLYRSALRVARAAGSRRIQRITAAPKRDDAFYGAWLASNAVSFELRRNK
jgi:hypothetical protein